MAVKGGRIKATWDSEEALPIDRQIRDRLGLSWKEAKALVTGGKVHVDGDMVNVLQAVPAVGARLSVDTDRRRPSRRTAFGEEQILLQDEHLLVVDKPSGLVSVPPTSTGEPTVLDHLVRITGDPVHGVHRLDHGTSGLMLFARSQEAAEVLDDGFRRHAVRRTYLAICHGLPQAPIRWEEPLTLHKPGAPPREVSAVTQLLSAEPAGTTAFVHLALETGRWHQVRLHAALHGHPILGDRDHGDPARDRPLRPPRLALHSRSLVFTHPITGETLSFECPLPPDLAQLLARLRDE